MAFTTVQARLLFPLMGLMRVALDLQTSSALFARIFEYLDLKPSITDAPDARDVAPGPALGRVEFDDVTFRYPDADDVTRPTLDGVSFTIEPGQYAAFVGPSGAGKTTVSYLVPRLYEASGGSVRFAGDDVRDLRQESLISNIGIVSQETYLFHATIAENLRYARPDATDAELEAAARAANIHETIASFPEGYDTVVGERGYRLSGGEKQRIAIARVLLKDPAVLVLDEATSALDTISERVVQQALDDAARGRTTIAIAHRLSTVVSADVIFVDRRRDASSSRARTPSWCSPTACTRRSTASRRSVPSSSREPRRSSRERRAATRVRRVWCEAVASGVGREPALVGSRQAPWMPAVRPPPPPRAVRPTASCRRRRAGRRGTVRTP